MKENSDVERTLAAIATLTPTPSETQHALARVRAALPRRRRYWIVPASCAAAVVLVAALLLMTFQTRASAAERLAQALAASRAYQGWVHMTTNTGVTHFNTQTGARAWYGKYYLGKDRVSAGYQNPVTHEYATYDSVNGLVLLSTLGPGWVESLRDKASDQPLNYPELLDYLKTHLDVSPAKITAKREGNFDRYDIGKAVSATTPAHPHIWPPADYPPVIWIDPKTGLIAKTLRRGETTTFTYGAPDIRSIFDAGVPRAAAVQDIRPTKEAAALADRIHAHIQSPFPDGVSVCYRESSSAEYPETHGSLIVHCRSGVNWVEHLYSAHAGSGTEKGLRLPAGWSTPGSTGAQEFFRRLAAALPDVEWSGDDKNADLRDFADPKQNAHLVGTVAQNLALGKNPTRQLYPVDVCYDSDHRLDLVTAPDRPGQVGLRVRALANNSPDLDRSDSIYWVDLSHSDRPVTSIESYYKTPGQPALACKVVTEFSSYRVLPAPDGRSYPTQWAKIVYTPDAHGNLRATARESMTFCFFPGIKLSRYSNSSAPASQP